MTRPQLAAAAALCLLVPSPAHAILYGGNPKLHIQVDRPAQDLVGGVATLDRVVLGGCPGAGPAVEVYADFDPVDGIDVDIPAGDWCSVTLEWGDVTQIEATGFEGESDASQTWTDLDPQTLSVSLAPFTVTQGTMSGAGPKVIVHVW